MAAELQAGARFAGYRIDGLLARGGMGAVYRACDEATGHELALKVIAAEIADDLIFRRRFEREARLAALLDHPHVVPVLDSGDFEGTLFIATKLIDGLNLHEVIAVEGPLSARAAARVTEQVASALDAAHAEGLFHRDVKPGNVLLEGTPAGGTAYLADFGLSKHMLSTSGLTRAGQWVGTIDQAAPEQLQAADVDHRVDVYALGCVLYEMLTGEVPFPRARDVRKMIAHLTEEPPAVSDFRPRAEAFDDVVRRALAKRPEDRYPSAGKLARAAVEAASRTPDPDEQAPPALRSRREFPGGSAAAGDAPTAA
jgi:serine/threonine protein kinase